MGLLKRLKTKFARRTLQGGKKDFVAERIELSREPKYVRSPGASEKIQARGKQGVAYDIVAYKGGHKAGLVIKKYNLKSVQTENAEREFRVFQRLRENGFPVPPTTRLVEIKGTKYLAITDLAKFGDMLTKDLLKVEKVLGETKMLELNRARLDLTQKARNELGIELTDSIEYIIDSKNKTVKMFILDLGAESYFKRHGVR